MKLPLCPRRYCATSYENVSDLVNNADMTGFGVLVVARLNGVQR